MTDNRFIAQGPMKKIAQSTQSLSCWRRNLPTLTFQCNDQKRRTLQQAVMVSKLFTLDQLLLTSEYDPHWVLYIFGLVPNLSYAQKIIRFYYVVSAHDIKGERSKWVSIEQNLLKTSILPCFKQQVAKIHESDYAIEIFHTKENIIH